MRTRRWVAVVVSVALLYSSMPWNGCLLFAAGTAAAAASSQVATISTQELSGKLLYPDGETPVAAAPVRVWSVAQKKFIYQTTTDAKGAYTLPQMSPGRYVLVYGDRVRVNLVVTAGKEPFVKFLNVIIPRGIPLVTEEQLAAELAGGAVAGGAAATAALLTAIVIAVAGGLLAVGVVGAAGGFGGGGGGPVSP